MATEGPIPTPCNPEIYRDGEPVVLLNAAANATERWVRAVAKKANARVDWHYSGGVAQVLHLGDDESRGRVETAIVELEDSLDGRILRRLTADVVGLYRSEVSDASAGAIAGYYDGGDSSRFITES